MKNPKHISGCAQFLNICPISMAQFQEKFIFLGEKPLPMCQSELIILQVIEDEGKPEREKFILSQPSRKNLGLDCSWTVAHPAHASHCGKESILCFNQSGPTPEAKLSVVTVP